jgi:hypothetical protein
MEVGLPDISNNVGSVKLFSATLLCALRRVVLFVFVDFCIDDHGSLVIFRSASVRPRHLFDQNFDHDYFFKLPLQGAGCSIKWTVFYFTPCPVPSCPAYEPNSIDGEYSQPFRHIQYKRTPSLRPIATLAMLLCRRIAK